MPAIRLTTASHRRGLPTTRKEQDALRRELRREVVRDTVNIAKSRVPVRTGRLKNSIEGRAVVNPGRVNMVFEAGAPYASYVEYGTIYQRPQPYMTPAWEWGVPRFRRLIREFIGRR